MSRTCLCLFVGLIVCFTAGNVYSQSYMSGTAESLVAVPPPTGNPMLQPMSIAEMGSPDKVFFPQVSNPQAYDTWVKQPFRMHQPDFLKCRGISVGGWIEQGGTLNTRDPADGFNGPIVTNDFADDYQLNQAWIYLVRPADNGGCGFAWGGRVDVTYGTDSRFGTNFGLETNINSPSNSYSLAIPQMYLEFAYNRLSIKLGHFAGILDYEAVPAPANPFYSHSLCYSYTVPQLVTGILGEYKLSDQLVLQAGMTRGWMMWEDMNHHMDVTGGIKWSSPSDLLSLGWAFEYGPQDPLGEQDKFASSLVAQLQMTNRLRWVIVSNVGFTKNACDNGTRDAEWYGINQYFLYKINECLSLNTRFEWLRDDDGTQVTGLGAALPGYNGWAGSGFAGDFFELTMGLNFKPNKNITVRPEVRYDWYNGLPGTGGQRPYGLTRDDQLTLAADVIFSF